ncbi:MAG: choice-of-anchor D domain-containing protein, partial [Deltaproteobacteria bacterium]|nr:choice-of-anchor D domain-containing protein [Deltaproteobacteria bacterium]
MRTGSVCALLVILLGGCSKGSPGSPNDAGLRPCTMDDECPPNYVCTAGYCEPNSTADAAVDRPAPAKMQVNPTLLDFGSPIVGAEYTKTFTIANVGGSQLTVTSVNVIEEHTNGAYSIASLPLPFVVAGGDAQTVTVILLPNDENLPTGSIKIHSDDPDPATADATVDLVAHAKGSPRLGVCVRNPLPPPDCTVSSDGNPVIDYAVVDYGTSAERIVALVDAGDGNLPIDISEVSLTDPTYFTLSLFALVDDPTQPGQKIEQPTALPFYLSPGDPTVVPPVPPTELRVHVRFTAVGIDGDVPHESLVVKYNLPDSPTTVPIIGKISGCRPANPDAGVPDGGADPQTDPENCGQCGHQCATPHGTPVCMAGVCKTGSCVANWGDCNDDPADGCEADLRITTDHCGTCAVGCVNPHGTTLCQVGICRPSCAAGYDDCNGDPNDGCETNTLTSSSNCGTCGHVCGNPHGTTGCVVGVCKPTCATWWADCDGDPSNGCETNTQTDVDNCDGCGKPCQNPGGTVSCAGGVCQPGCDPGRADCDANPANGCETNILADVTRCGSCTNSCTNAHGTTSCQAGSCAPVCAAGYADCDGSPNNGCETNTQIDGNNCGGCGVACVNPHGTTSCASGQCVPSCQSGWGNCNSNVIDGCETPLTTVQDCGGCGRPCTNSHGSTTCAAGQCSPTCAAGWADCDANKDNGCETDLASLTHCGACGNACVNPHGTTSCNGTACAPTCSAGFADCNANPSDGCETDLSTVTFCGTCTIDAQCVAGFFCNGAQCEKKRPAGTLCALAKECSSGFCVDGRCCASLCDAACRTCANAAGSCDPVTNGDDVPQCQGTMTCDATAACKKKPGQACAAGGECASGFCKDGACCPVACDAPCRSCATGLCLPVTSADDVPECSGIQSCDAAGNCRSKLGQPCATAGDCVTGFCKDGTCCDSACTAACKTCVTGTCAPVAGADDAPECTGATTCDLLGNCKKKNGQACAAGGECASSFCKDGKCCNSACDQACESCATGACTTVVSADDSPECSGNYTCDGVGACKKKTAQPCVTGGDCASGFCKDGVCCDTGCAAPCKSCTTGTCATVTNAEDAPECAGASICDAAGVCRLKGGQSCTQPSDCVSGFCKDGMCCNTACDTPCRSCATGTCTPVVGGDDSPECAGSNTCDAAGACKKKNGQTCAAASDCASAFCKDGKCCNTACDQACQSCATGTCTPVVSGDDSPECAGNNSCDAAGACKKKTAQPCAAASECVSGFCKDGFCCNATCDAACQSCATGTCASVVSADDNPECAGTNTCDATGACKKKNGQACLAASECASGNCKDGKCCNSACTAACQTCATGACTTVVSTDDTPDCTGRFTCDAAGACKRKAGQACTVAGDCASGFCKDGVCCNGGCTAPCLSCATGTCTPVVSADDAPECTGANTCNASGACRLKSGQTCAAASDCASGFCKDGKCCDTACAAACQTCATGACATVVSGDDPPECTGGYTCDMAGACKKKTGQACSAAGECATGFCKDGFCCNTGCNAPCQSCTTGTCSSVASADDNPECTGNLTCDGVGACKKKLAQPCVIGGDCASGFCKDGVCCDTACTTPCKSCTTGTCTTVASAEDPPECTGSYTCDAGGVCRLKGGQSCTLPSDCGTGFCKDGVCCNAACTAPCLSCSTGTCTPVVSGDDNPECTGTATCDVAGACRQKNGQGCAAASDCASGFCKDGKCCNTACDQACLSCLTGACTPVVSADDVPECTGNNTCDATGACRKKIGQACGAAGECVSGFCKDGVCCNTTCDGACQSCTTGSCATVVSADDNPECTGSFTCDAAGACKKKNGEVCVAAIDCASGFCKDG